LPGVVVVVVVVVLIVVMHFLPFAAFFFHWNIVDGGIVD
jgi:hypothetical protein